MMDGVLAIGYAQQLFDSLASGLDHAEDVGDNTLRFHWLDGTTTDVVLTSGSASTKEEITANTSCGGVTSGQTIPLGTDLTDLAKLLLVKYLAPVVAFTSDTALIFENGTTQQAPRTTINVTKKSESIQSIKCYCNNVLETEITNNIENGGTFIYNPSDVMTSTTVYKVEVSDGKSTTTKTITINFVDPIYLGYETSGSHKYLQLKGDIVFDNVTCTLDKPQIKYPKSWGVPKSFVDVNGFSMMNSFIVTEETINNVDYYVYTNSGITTVTDFKYTMEF